MKKRSNDIIKSRRTSAPVIPFYNSINKEQKKEEAEYKKKIDLNDISEGSDSNEDSYDSSEEARQKNKTDTKPKKPQIKTKPEKKKEIDDTNMSTDYRKITGKFRNFNSFSLSSSKLSRQLKELLTQKYCLRDFSDWFNSVIVSMQSDDLNEFITMLDCIQESDDLTTEFFKYVYNLSKSKSKGYKYTFEADRLYKDNQLGPICFITPELGRWTSVGNVGKTVDELTRGLCNLGQDVFVIAPYYTKNSRGKTNYLEKDPYDFRYIRDVSINLDGNYSFGVYNGESHDGIKYYFLENKNLFQKAYQQKNTPDKLREIACLAKAALQLLCDISVIPSVIVTNDWVTGLTPAYGKNGSFGDVFKHTKFMHLAHNLEPCFEGKLYFDYDDFQSIYNFDRDWLINPYSNEKVINPSRCAILKGDQWATISKSYKRHLQLNSPLADLLNQKPCPFAYPLGVFVKEKLKEIKSLTGGGNKDECKEYIQQQYFEFDEIDHSIPVYSYVGDISENSGVMLILDSFEEILRKTNRKINLLIIGTGNYDDPYYKDCVNKMERFKEKYPYSFWSSDNEMTKDLPKIFLGSDFGIIPSKFDTGGTRQFEYLICGAPVLAFKTGSLKDTITEFNYQTNLGNGVIFDYYNDNEFLQAFMRSLNIFNNKEKYEICCENAKKSVIDVSEVSKAWCKEFCKLKHKLFFDNSKIQDTTMSEIPDNLLIKDYGVESSINVRSNFIPSKKRRSNFFGIDAFQSKNLFNKFNFDKDNGNGNDNDNEFDKGKEGGGNFVQNDEVVKKFTFYYINNVQPKVVEISGSFDNWKKRHRLIHYPREKKWEISKKLKKGKHLYKYIIDGDWQTNPREPTEKGDDGIVNNVIYL